jgi:SAM-dependent methyltransferase
VVPCSLTTHYLQTEVTDSRLAQYGPYDLISMTHVVEHLVEPVAVVSRCRELLAPDGLIFVTAPHRPRGWQDAMPDLTTWTAYSYNHVPAHIQYFSEASLERLATTCNCALVYWSHDHEGGEAFEAWLAHSDAAPARRWLDRVRMAFRSRRSKVSIARG